MKTTKTATLREGKQDIIFKFIQRYDEYTDYDAYINGKAYRLTLVDGNEPYLVRNPDAD